MTEKEKKIFERCIQHFLGFESAEQYVTENKNCELQNSSIIILLIE
jgi:predicted lactoylglutathione lyase